MLISGQLLTDESHGRCGLRAGTIRVHHGRIEQIDWDQISEHAEIGGQGYFVSPGFIDAHVHLPQFDIIGAHGMPLLKWLDEIVFPSEAQWSDTHYAASMVDRVASQCLSHGTTSMAAFATVHHESAIAAIQRLTERGLSGLVGQVLMDREAPKELCRDASQLIDEAASLQERFAVDTPIRSAITPRFAISCSAELLEAAGRLANQQQAFVQTHFAETAAECERVEELFGGQSYIDVYEQAGLLGEKSLLGHGIHVDSLECLTLSKTQTVIAHCPLANSFLRSGSMNRGSLIKSGVRLAIGSDIGAGYERSMVRVARAMIETAALVQRHQSESNLPDCRQAWHSITASNADALGLPRVGRIQVGSVADLVIAKPTMDWQDGMVDPLSKLMFAWDDRWIETVLTAGRFRYRSPT